MNRFAPVLTALAAVGTVLALYAALGGGRYQPTPVADPCLARETTSGDGTAATLERIALATVDGAACKLGVSREALVLSLRDRAAFESLATSRGISPADAERALAASLADGIDAADEAGDLPGFVAELMRGLVERTPPWLLLDLLDRVRGFVS
jgi:hypothetical protein